MERQESIIENINKEFQRTQGVLGREGQKRQNPATLNSKRNGQHCEIQH